jgi:hypothetical protein
MSLLALHPIPGLNHNQKKTFLKSYNREVGSLNGPGRVCLKNLGELFCKRAVLVLGASGTAAIAAFA